MTRSDGSGEHAPWQIYWELLESEGPHDERWVQKVYEALLDAWHEAMAGADPAASSERSALPPGSASPIGGGSEPTLPAGPITTVGGSTGMQRNVLRADPVEPGPIKGKNEKQH